jgi:NAD(P)-dependent dehydrogenase (short-subunit alcohol dehydrogenase family)
LERARKEDKIMGERVKGRVAIVTGAGSIGPGIGNGKASAIIYAREGARVLAVDYNLEAAKETKRLIDGEGGECIAFKANVAKSSDCKSMVDKCIHAFGRVDILHNNVGIVEPGGPVEISEETWDRVISVNLKSMFLSCKYALPYMENQGGGCIVNISSISAIRALSYSAITYAASKAGVIALTRDIAIQYAAKGIRANVILPGYINTPLVVASLTQTYGGNVDEMIKKRDAMCPTGKQGDAWDVAYAALFLASDEAKYITGATLVVDGGITCTHKMF